MRQVTSFDQLAMVSTKRVASKETFGVHVVRTVWRVASRQVRQVREIDMECAGGFPGNPLRHGAVESCPGATGYQERSSGAGPSNQTSQSRQVLKARTGQSSEDPRGEPRIFTATADLRVPIGGRMQGGLTMWASRKSPRSRI